MELMLWRWSTAVQVTSLLMIAVFFTVLGRSIRTAALRWWVRAWQANFAALAITLFFWFFQPPEWMLRFVVGPLYMSLKMAFVVLLIQGAWAMKRPGAPLAVAADAGRWASSPTRSRPPSSCVRWTRSASSSTR